MKRILIVEDDSDIATAVRIGLQAKGHEVLLAGSGRQMNEVLSGNRIDVILLDLGLPDVDGIDLISQVRRWSDMLIVVVSARHDSHGKVAALDAGADDYVTKPFSLGEVLARLRAIDRRSSASVDSGIVRTADGRMVIDLASHVLEVEEVPVHLTPLEWKMLEVFAKHKGALVDAKTLLTEVWGPGFGGERGYLRIYMSHLRQKLEADPARPEYFHTHTGMGYRFTP